MNLPTSIRSISIEQLNIPLSTPFDTPSGAQTVAQNVLLTIELHNGIRGYGEAAPLPSFNGETQMSAMAALNNARSLLEGADVREWRLLATTIRKTIGPIYSAQCAIEMAILDAFTRHLQMPMWALFGGNSMPLYTDMTIGNGSIDEIKAKVQTSLNRGVGTLKIKITGKSVDYDLERVATVHRIAPNTKLILDGIGSYTADYALELMAVLKAHHIPIVLLEQPVPRKDWQGLQQVSRWAGVPVAADESLSNSHDALRIAREFAAQVLNIKLMKCGILEALDIAAIARTAGLGLMIGSMVESKLAMSVSACFASGVGGFSFVDLDSPLFMSESPFEGGPNYYGAHLDLSNIRAGHGVIPKAR
jgi:L-alanine-DL-glutamate epimerase-like enolase superfamily enzyme